MRRVAIVARGILSVSEVPRVDLTLMFLWVRLPYG